MGLERGTGFPIVIYGPEGCGKSVLLLQAVEVFKEMGYSIIYFNPLSMRFEAEVCVESVKQLVLDRLKQALTEHEFAKLIWLVIDVAVEILRHRKKRLAIIVDDAFQYLSTKEAAAMVKGLLEVIEHPEESYERIVAIVATSEGLSRFEIGKHLWAWIMPMWNMSRKGFEELYSEVPDRKPRFDDVWMHLFIGKQLKRHCKAHKHSIDSAPLALQWLYLQQLLYICNVFPYLSHLSLQHINIYYPIIERHFV
jgi:hypothetical protein